MANYQETEVNGTKWRRCHQVALHNHRNTTPSMAFFEEDVMSVDGKVLRLSEASCGTTYNANGVIQLYNPLTLEPTGETVTHDQLYLILFSAYIQTALERDAAQEAILAEQANNTPIVP